MIPYARQEILQQDIDQVLEVLQSDFLTQGPQVPAFESVVANYCEVNHALAVNSATSALHIACLALGVGAGDEVWTSAITFVASANCARYCGADVDFVDIDCRTFNLCPDALREKLEHRSRSGGRMPKVVIPVHMCGQSCDMQAIKALSERYGFAIIEDASHAIGGRYQNARVGSCHYSDMTVFSFHPVKIVTSAEGGMVTTNNSNLADRLALFRGHGITRDQSRFVDAPELCHYQQLELGYNYRLTDIQAALGRSQMSRIDSLISRRHALANRYDRALANLPVQCPNRQPDTFSSFHLYVILLDDTVRGGRLQIYESMLEQGIGVNIHYMPVHLQPYYRQRGFSIGDFPVAEDYHTRTITLPLYPAMSANDQRRVIDALVRSIATYQYGTSQHALPLQKIA
jgi:UDP-4-amino-4,6-dideoxy-N-acetyl-beta-L-altrosamine transaminase